MRITEKNKLGYIYKLNPKYISDPGGMHDKL